MCGSAVPVQSRKKKARTAPTREQIQPAARNLTEAASSAAIKASPDTPALADNGDSYGVSVIRRCPNCQRDMGDEEVLCLACGYNLKTGDQAVRVFEPVERTWDGVLSYPRRVQLFAAAQAVGLFGLVGAIVGGFFLEGLCSWLLYTLLLAFILGTFDRVEVSRNRRGQVSVKKTRRFCFMPWQPEKIALQRYAGVTTGPGRDADLWDWLMLGVLLSFGCLPGILWWYFVFHREMFYVGLVKEHGSLGIELYRGWDMATTLEIAQVLRDVGSYPPV
jgi:hypothetical protein